MAELYTVMSEQPALELLDKDPVSVSDYQVDFAPMIEATAQLDSVGVTIEKAGTGESPIALDVSDIQAVTPDGGSAATAAAFWLSGGTPGTRYLGKIEVTSVGDGSPAPARAITKRFLIVVTGYVSYGSPEATEGWSPLSPDDDDDDESEEGEFHD